ncbi:WD40 repeat domain-containing protein [Thermoflexus hugenholtzii]
MLRGDPRSRSLIGLLALIPALTIPSQGPVSSFWLVPDPEGWTLRFRPALASARVAPQGEWIWLAFQREGIIHALAIEGHSGRVRAQIRLGTSVCCLPPPLAMTPDGRWALVGGDAVWAYAPERGRRRLFSVGPADSVVALAIAPGGQVAAGATLKGWVLLFDPARGEILRRWDPEPGQREVPAVAFAPDGRELWIAWDRRLEVWSLPALALRAARPLPFDGTLILTAIAQDGTWGLVLGYRGEALEGWILRREDLRPLRVRLLEPIALPRLQATAEGFQIDSLWEPFSFQVYRDGRVERKDRRPAAGSFTEWMETLCGRSGMRTSPCGQFLGANPPLADRFRWEISIELQGKRGR